MERETPSAAEAFKALVQNFSGAKPSIGKVKRGTVDEDKRICEVTPFDGGPKISRVFLNVITDADVLIVPADDSYVAYMHALNFRNQAYIIACSKIRKIILKTSPAGTVSFELSDAGVEVKAGANGRVKIAAAGTEIGSGAQKMVRGDELNTLLGQVLTALQAVVLWGATGVAPGPAGGIAPLAGVTVPTIPATLLSSKNKVE